MSALGEMPNQFERLFHLIPTGYLSWKPQSWEGIPGEKFSALEQACHLRDIETDGYQVRIRRILEEEHPSLVALDGYQLARQRHYSDANPEEVIVAFSEAREITLDLLRRISANQMERTAVFAEYGEVTLKGLVHFLCSHDQQHIACMHWILGKIES